MLTPALIGLLAAGPGGAIGSTPAAGAAPAAQPEAAAEAEVAAEPMPAARSPWNRLWFADRSPRGGLGFGGAQLGIEGRLDLGRFSSALEASFARWSVGVGLEGPLRGPPPAGPIGPRPTIYGLLVARVGYGFYLGRPKVPRGELYVYYDRERQLFGEDPRTVPSYLRHGIGVEGTLFLTPRVGVHFDARLGTTWSAGLSLVVGF